MSKLLKDHDVAKVAEKLCVGWCTCVTSIIKKLTPRALASYCEMMGFEPFPGAISDETGTRWTYLLRKENVMRDGKPAVANRVAGFGEFNEYPKNSLESCLEAVISISKYHGGDPKQIVEEIVGSAPSAEGQRREPDKGVNAGLTKSKGAKGNKEDGDED